MAEVSLAVSTIGLIIPFILTDPAVSGTAPQPISNAVSVTSVIWVTNTGRQRTLTLSQPVSATWTYVTSLADTRTVHIEEGYLQIAFGTNVFYSSSFMMSIHGHF